MKFEEEIRVKYYVKKDCPYCPKIHTVIKMKKGYKCPSCNRKFLLRK